MARPKSNKIKHARRDPATIRARELDLPEAQIRHGFVLHDVANYTEDDQRAMVRSKKTETVRRKTRIEKLRDRGTISHEHARACEWYSSAHEYGYATIGCTANYSGMSGHGFGPKDQFARTRQQVEARADYIWARLGIPLILIPLFERVVLNGANLDEASEDIYAGWGKAKRIEVASVAFKEAADALVARLERVTLQAA
jgi:hypothetical protein